MIIGHFFINLYLLFLKKDKPMKKVYIFYLSFVLTILISTIVIGQVVVFEDNFESYTSGQQLACQNPTVWTTWTNSPCSAIEDAFISNIYSFNGANSVVINQNNDIVREIGTPLSSGVAEINFLVYIPATKSGYFNTLASFAPPNYVWAMQVFLNSSGTGTLDAGGANAATFSYPQNQWFPIKVIADLTANIGEFWINDVKVYSWTWSRGTFGTTIPKQLDGTDFFGYSVDDEMYIDDYNITHTPYTAKVSSKPTGGNWSSGSTWVGDTVPNQNTVAEIVYGSTVYLTANRNRNARTIVRGTLNCGTFNITGNGDFVLSSNATLQIGSALGISLTGATGNIRATGTRIFNSHANYIYTGSATQITGNGLPASIKNLTINNSSGISLSSNTSVSKALDLVNGNLLTGSNTLTLGTSITNSASIAYSSGIIVGNFNRWISNSIDPVLFPVGTSSTKYTPVTLTNILGSGIFTVSAVDGPHPNALGTDFLQMYWKLTNSGITSADVVFNYLDADVVGDEESYELFRYDGNMNSYSPFNLNTTTNIASVNGLSSFSDWTLGINGNLPVELSSFTADVIGKSVRLNWKTETEVNNYGFEIQKSAVGSQNTEWEIVGFVNGNGNSNSPKNYSFIDNEVSAGKPAYQTGRYFYRLKQVDNDGKFEYSYSIEIDLGNPTEYSLEQNYPNPFNPNTIISFTIPEAGNVKIKLFNLLGEEIQTLFDEIKDAGTHTVNFSAQNLNSGVYLYKIESGNFTQVRKMTLIK
jgi:hypothetical protein